MSFIKLSSVFIGALLVTEAAAAEARVCPVKAGETVSFVSPKAAFTAVSVPVLTKGEFESSAEFEARKAAQGAVNVPETLMVEGTYFPDHVTYDADTERYRLNKYAWANVGSGYERASYPLDRAYFDSIGKDDHYASNVPIFGVGLSQERVLTGKYQASNAMGASVIVQKQDTLHFGVFDSSLPMSKIYEEDPRLVHWETLDEPSTDPSPYYDKRDAVVYLPMPLADAKKLKKDFKVGFALRPKAPFTVKDTTQSEPTFDLPIENTNYYRILIADIQCAIITDMAGKIVKTVPVIVPD